ncbi:MAG: hypothetical protein ACI9YT_000918 [Halobacteriales archaeon]|jgi:hypothetical protein
MVSQLSLTMLPVGGLFGLLGYLIREREMLHLIAGYDPSKVSDKAGLADFFGTHMYVLALLTLGTVGVDATFGQDGLLWGGYWVAFAVVFVRLLLGSRTYEDG